LQDILEGEGCRVYLAPGGREALALFDSRSFDGVLTDVGMPGMSGWELAQAIRAPKPKYSDSSSNWLG
jgi:CheY-like chemotaxis protein